MRPRRRGAILRAHRVLPIVAALAAVAGCRQLLGLDGDPYVTAPDAGWSVTQNDASPPPTPGNTMDAAPGSQQPDADALAPACDTETDSNNCGQCGHVCTIGTCMGGFCTPQPIALGQTGISDIVADDGGVYWLTDTALMTCPLSGCQNNPTALTSGLQGPGGLALDDTSVYWGCISWSSFSGPSLGGMIAQCPRPDCSGGGSVLVNGATVSGGGALAAAQGWLAWLSDVGGGPGANGGLGLFACQVDGAGGVCTPNTLQTQAPDIAELALNPSATPPLYFNSGETGNGAGWCGSLSSCQSTGSAGYYPADVNGLAMDDTAVYIASDQIYSCPLGTNCFGPTGEGNVPAATVVSSIGGSMILVSGGMLFWVGGSQGGTFASETVYTCSPSDCASPLALLAPGTLGEAGGLAVTDCFVFVTDFENGTVLQVSR